jgi:hypothetical protein
MKSVDVVLVIEKRRQRAVLVADEATSDGMWVLMLDGVAQAPDELKAGAYLLVADPQTADQAALAGYAIEPPKTRKRRTYSILGKVYGIGLLAGVAGALFWAVREALELDVLGVLAWLGLGAFLAVLGLGWWFAGEEIMLDEEVTNRLKARRFRRWIGSVGRRR